jgi:hypothetical protein
MATTTALFTVLGAESARTLGRKCPDTVARMLYRSGHAAGGVPALFGRVCRADVLPLFNEKGGRLAQIRKLVHLRLGGPFPPQLDLERGAPSSPFKLPKMKIFSLESIVLRKHWPALSFFINSGSEDTVGLIGRCGRAPGFLSGKARSEAPTDPFTTATRIAFFQ